MSPTLNVHDNRHESRATVLTVMGEVTHTLTSDGSDGSEDGSGRGTPIITFSHTAGLDLQPSTEATPSLLAGQDRMPSVARHPVLRRLTPEECEALQDLPRGWTAKGVRDDGSVKRMADSARYRQCGNGLTTAIPEWIIGHILEIEADLAGETSSATPRNVS